MISYESLSLSDMAPNTYELYQNYPNPFNPTTNIRYGLPIISNVNITIYDILGNKVDVLYSGLQTPGYYSLLWDASKYASGVYFVKMNSGNFISVQKIILIR